MVRLPLKQNLSALLKRLQRPGVGIVLVSTATLLVVVALVGVTAEKDRGARRPSLLDLLNDVGMDKDSGQTIKGEPPVPPKALAWASPLARQCSGIDPNVRERLLKHNHIHDTVWFKDEELGWINDDKYSFRNPETQMTMFSRTRFDRLKAFFQVLVDL